MPLGPSRSLAHGELEGLLSELALVSSRAQLFLRIVTKVMRGDARKAAAPGEGRDEAAPKGTDVDEVAFMALIQESDLTKMVHDLTAAYVTLEEYFMREGIAMVSRARHAHGVLCCSCLSGGLPLQAIAADSPLEGDVRVPHTTTVVDDAFHVLSTSLR